MQRCEAGEELDIYMEQGLGTWGVMSEGGKQHELGDEGKGGIISGHYGCLNFLGDVESQWSLKQGSDMI